MNSISFYDGVGILPVHGFSIQKDTHTSGKPNNSLSPLHHHGAGGQDSALPFGQVSREVMERTVHSQGSEPCQPHCSVKGLARKGFRVGRITLGELTYPDEDQKVG